MSDSIFDAIANHTVPVFNANKLKKTTLTRDAQNTLYEEEEAQFIRIYGLNEEEHKAKKLYNRTNTFALGHAIAYKLPEKETGYQSDERSDQDKFFFTFNNVVNNIDDIANYVVEKKPWFFGLFGDSAAYKIGQKFLSDVADTITTRFHFITQPKSANLAGKSFTHFIQLNLLKESPAAFAQSKKNHLLLNFTDQIPHMRKELWDANKSREVKIESLDKMKKKLKEFKENIDQEVLEKNISALENSWTRKLFGWMTGDNKKLEDLKQLRIVSPLITGQTENIQKEIDAQYKIELAKNDFFNLCQSIKDENTVFTLETIKKFQMSIKPLLQKNNLLKLLVLPELNNILATLNQDLSDLLFKPTDKNLNNRVTKSLSALLSLKETSAELAAHYENEFEKALRNLLESIEDPILGANYCDQLLNDLKNVDTKIYSDLKIKNEQFSAWRTLKRSKNGEKIATEEAYLSLCALTNSSMTAKMEQDVNEFLNHYVKQTQLHFAKVISSNLKKPTDETKQNIAQLKEELKLLSTDKLNILKKSKLHELRTQITTQLINHLADLQEANDLEMLITLLEDIWPDGILPKYVTITNESIDTFTWNMTQQANKIPNNIKLSCDNNLLEFYKPSITDITLEPHDSCVLYFIPKSEDTIVKSAIKSKKEELLGASINQEAKNKFTFLKNNNTNILYQQWKRIFHDNNTPLNCSNLFNYGESIFFDSLHYLINKARAFEFHGMSAEASWIRFMLIEEVELIARSFDQKLQMLLEKEDLKKTADVLNAKIDPIDIGHLLLQWRFINLFRNEFYVSCDISGATGNAILHKMYTLVKEDPKFIHHFLGSMNQEQLNTLKYTLHGSYITNMTRTKKRDKRIEMITILHETCELVKQELLSYLNGEEINLKLFNEHVAYVLQELQAEAIHIKWMQNREFANDLKVELISGMKWLLGEEIPKELVEQIHVSQDKLEKSTNIIEFIREFPQEISDKLPEDLADYIADIQYHFADRFKNSLEQLLSKRNLTRAQDYQLLNELKNGPLYTLVDSVIHNEKDICRIFSIEKYHPVQLPKTNWEGLSTLTKMPGKVAKYLYDGASNTIFTTNKPAKVEEIQHKAKFSFT